MRRHTYGSTATSEDRWIGEAWAEFYGVTAGRRIGASGATFDLTDELLDSRIPLNDWGAIGVESLQVEDFAYAATYSLARRIADRPTWRACVRSGRRPTRRDGLPADPCRRAGARGVDFDLAGWQQLLDLLEERTGASYTDLWQDWVVNDEQQRRLAARQAARHAYAETVAAAEDWELPESIRADLGRGSSTRRATRSTTPRGPGGPRPDRGGRGRPGADATRHAARGVRGRWRSAGGGGRGRCRT